MQIHELTYKKKRPVSEVNWGAVGKAIGSAANAGAANYLQQKTGMDVSKIGNNPYGDQITNAAKAAEPVIKAQAEQQQKLWNEGVAKTMQAQNVSSPGQLSTTSAEGIKKSLLNQVHANLLQRKVGNDYTQLPNWVDDKVKPDATNIVHRIGGAIEAILDYKNPNKTAQQSMSEWYALSKAAYEAMSLISFYPSHGTGQAPKSAAGAQPTQNPAVAQATQQLTSTALTPAALAAVQKIMGGLPTVSSPDPQTQAYLQALGFNVQ